MKFHVFGATSHFWDNAEEPLEICEVYRLNLSSQNELLSGQHGATNDCMRMVCC